MCRRTTLHLAYIYIYPIATRPFDNTQSQNQLGLLLFYHIKNICIFAPACFCEISYSKQMKIQASNDDCVGQLVVTNSKHFSFCLDFNNCPTTLLCYFVRLLCLWKQCQSNEVIIQKNASGLLYIAEYHVDLPPLFFLLLLNFAFNIQQLSKNSE